MKLLSKPKSCLMVSVTLVWAFSVQAQETLPGADVASLIAYARERNPEYAAMRYEAEAASERIGPAGALPRRPASPASKPRSRRSTQCNFG